MVGGGSGGLSSSANILSSTGLPSSSVYDSLGSGRMYSSRRSGSLERGGSRMDERGGGMESRMSGRGNMYSSSGSAGSRLVFDHAREYDHGRAADMDYDRVDRSVSDYARSDTNNVFVRNVCCSYYYVFDITFLYLAFHPPWDCK